MYSEKTISSFSKYTSYIEENCVEEHVLFRGQPNDDPLLPKIARIELKDQVGLIERRMLSEFKRQSIPHLSYQCKTDWDWMALAQHHGMATRLLDWTTNPLSALWFTVNMPPLKKDHGVVWVFIPPEQDIITPDDIAAQQEGPFEGRRTKIFQPNCITTRIVAQGGWFTVHKWIDEKKKFVPLEENKIYNKHLTKLIIPADIFSDFRYTLDRFGINHASMFPGLDGISRHVEWINSYLSDEKIADKFIKSTMLRNKKASRRKVRKKSRKKK